MQQPSAGRIFVKRANEHNLKGFDIAIKRAAITVVTGVSGSGKSSLAFDIVLSEANRRFFHTLSQYTRQFLDLGTRPEVGAITGLSPAVALAQNETQPSLRATVGSFSDLNEIIGVLMARFGQKVCPTHFLPTSALPLSTMVEQLSTKHEGAIVAICSPVANQKKGRFKQQIGQFAKKGYSKAYIDGEVVSIIEPVDLDKDQKHDIKVVIDYVSVKKNKAKRLEQALTTAFEFSGEFAEYFVSDKEGQPTSKFFSLSSRDGCPECGFSWPKLDARFFSMNSLGRCPKCDGLGYLAHDEQDEEDRFETVCPSCRGTGVMRSNDAIQYDGKGIHQLLLMPIDRLTEFFEIKRAKLKKHGAPAELRLVEEVCDHLQRIKTVGLDYLNLSRRLRSLSSGEFQRLRLSSALAENLRGVLYVLDEPSQGLSYAEIDSLWTSIEQLKNQGNTVIIVDHDETMMRRADEIVDLGPGGGSAGGEIVGQFSPEFANKFRDQSLTARYLSRRKDSNQLTISKSKAPEKFIKIVKPSLHNLKLEEVQIPLERISVVHGVSGAGKSSLITGVLYRNLKATLSGEFDLKHVGRIDNVGQIEKVTLINRKPIAKSSVSMPATYLDIFTELRQLYGKLPHSQIYGLTPRTFSLSTEGGRCDNCKGKGYELLSMKFLADAKIKCEVCQGARYKPHVLMAKYKGKSLSELLDMSIAEALDHLSTFKKIVAKLQPAVDLGLGYLKLGQPSNSLSGGESQRLKLAAEFKKKFDQGHLIILDEPTTGLHISDVERLVTQLAKLREAKATIIVLEHHDEVKKHADWLIELGPGAAQNGGQLVSAGAPKKVRNTRKSRVLDKDVAINQ